MTETNENVSNKIAMLQDDISQIIRCLVQIETHDNLDSRSYTSLDLIEALDITQRIIFERLNHSDSVDEWKNDHKRRYSALWTSIKKQVIETLTTHFVDKNKKLLRFVHTFNNLIVERMILMFQHLEPSGTLSLGEFLFMEFRAVVEELDSEDPREAEIARNTLQNYRKVKMEKPVLTYETRLDYIRSLFEHIQHHAA